MKIRPDTEHLLEDIFQESVTPDFRAVMLAETLWQVRQQRAARRRQRVLVIAVAALTVSLALWRSQKPAPAIRLAEAPAVGSARPVQVRSLPLRAEMIVESAPAGVAIVVSARTTAAVIESRSDQKSFQEIDDPELLLLVAGRPAALVRPIGQPPQLLFLNPAEEEGFPLQ
jgi:hypothetical protein